MEDKRLLLRSKGDLSFLDWVRIYNNGEPLCDWKKVFASHKETTK